MFTGSSPVPGVKGTVKGKCFSSEESESKPEAVPLQTEDSTQARRTCFGASKTVYPHVKSVKKSE